MKTGWAKVTVASKYFGVSDRTFRGLLKQGFPHSRLPSGTILIELAAGDSWLRERDVERVGNRIVNELLEELTSGEDRKHYRGVTKQINGER